MLTTGLVLAELIVTAAGVLLAVLAVIIGIVAFYERKAIKHHVEQIAKQEVATFLKEQAPGMFRAAAQQEADDMYEDLSITHNIEGKTHE